MSRCKSESFAVPADTAKAELMIGYGLFGAGVDTQRQKIKGWLAHEFSLTANLPSGHPYKSSAPTSGA